MSGLPWFRYWSETKDDPKLHMMARELEMPFASIVGAWSIVLCLAAGSPRRGELYVTVLKRYCNDDVTRMFGFDDVTSQKILQAMFDYGLLETNEEGGIRVKSFDKRNKKSDFSNERVQRHRNSKKPASGNGNVTLQNGTCNGFVTDGNGTESESESDLINTNTANQLSDFAQNNELSTHFSNETKILPFSLQKWTDAVQDMVRAGVTTGELTAALKLLERDGMTVTGPWSVSGSAIAVHARVKTGKPVFSNPPKSNGRGKPGLTVEDTTPAQPSAEDLARDLARRGVVVR